MTEQQKTSEAASVADLATLRRSIQMSWFADQKTRNEVAHTGVAKTCGQVVGRITEVTEREVTDRSGAVFTTLFALGEFQAVHIDTGEVIESGVAYLPKYFLESAASILKRDAASPGLDFAIELVLEATGKNIPVAWMVRPLLQKPADNPLTILKARLAAAGRLKLPPPVESEVISLPGELHGEAEGETAGSETQATPPAGKTKVGARQVSGEGATAS